MSYRIARRLPEKTNDTRSLVLRQQYALSLLPLLRDGTRIINIDESWINETNFTRQQWCPAQTPSTITMSPVTHRLSLIAALDTGGNVFFSLTQANTDQNIMLAFLTHLIVKLDQELGAWRDDTIFLLDNAKYHKGAEIRSYIRKLKIDIMWSAPYSFSTAPIENVFAHLKLGELNQKGHPNGKKVSTSMLHG